MNLRSHKISYKIIVEVIHTWLIKHCHNDEHKSRSTEKTSKTPKTKGTLSLTIKVSDVTFTSIYVKSSTLCPS